MTEEEMCRKIAEILGPNSAAQQALYELERRRRNGEEDVGVFHVGKTWWIGPKEAAP